MLDDTSTEATARCFVLWDVENIPIATPKRGDVGGCVRDALAAVRDACVLVGASDDAARVRVEMFTDFARMPRPAKEALVSVRSASRRLPDERASAGVVGAGAVGAGEDVQSGVRLVDNGLAKKEQADKQIMLRMDELANDFGTDLDLVVVTSDHDFLPKARQLRESRGVRVFAMQGTGTSVEEGAFELVSADRARWGKHPFFGAFDGLVLAPGIGRPAKKERKSVE